MLGVEHGRGGEAGRGDPVGCPVCRLQGIREVVDSNTLTCRRCGWVSAGLAAGVKAASFTGAANSAAQAQNMKNCPDCAESVRVEARKCRFCGVDFAKICPDCAEEVLAEARKCRHCGYRFAPPPLSNSEAAN